MDSALNRAAAYGVPGFQTLENDLAAQGKIHIPGVGNVSPEQIGNVVAMGPLAANTAKNLVSQALADTARRGAIYAAAKMSLQGTTTLASGATASAGAQLAEGGTVDPQKTAIDALTTLPLMMADGESLMDNGSMFASNNRVEDQIDFDTMKRADGPQAVDTPLALNSPEQVKADLQSHSNALPPSATASNSDFEVLPPEEAASQTDGEETAPSTLDVQSENVPSTQVAADSNLESSEVTPDADGFIPHDGVAFSPSIVAPSQSLEDDATKLVAAHLSDGIRANGIQGQRIDTVNDPTLPAVFTRSDNPSTMYINSVHAPSMVNLDDYTRQIYFDRVADEEAKHQATVQGIQQAFPGQDPNSVLIQAYSELTPQQAQSIVESYGGQIADAWNRVQGGIPSDALKADIAMEGTRMLLQQRGQEPTTEQMAIPERESSMAPFETLIKGTDPNAPTLSTILDAAQKIDNASRTGQVQFRGRYPSVTPRIGFGPTGAAADSGAAVPGNRTALHEIASPEAVAQGSSGRNQNAAPSTFTFSGASNDLAGFYSKLARAVDSKMPGRAPASAVLAMLKGSGVNSDELKWSGVEEYLGKNPSLTKADLQRFLKEEGGVRVQTTQLEDLTYKEITDEEDLHQQATGQPLIHPGEAKYSQYQLPGGENYREQVFSLPPVGMRAKTAAEKAAHYRQKQEIRDREASMLQDAISKQPPGGYDDRVRGARNSLRGNPDWESIQSDKKAFEDSERREYEKAIAQNYLSGHFPEAGNYLAHMRLNDRTDSEGQPGTFIEEMQSDRHQEGRDKGYNGDVHRVLTKVGRVAQSPMNTFPSREAAEKWIAENGSPDDHEAVPSVQGTPDAPFRKTWHEFLFRKALNDAVAGGKKWVGWTTGDTQADRYDLSRQLNDVQITKLPQDKYMVTASDKGGRSVLNERVDSGDKLAALIGKELATKATSQEEGELHKYEGLDLRVGGEGMKGFYDGILPQYVSKYVKKWGVKPELASIQTRDPELRPAIPGGDGSRKQMPAEATPIWKVPITDEMRQSIQKEGQPLISGSSKDLLARMTTVARAKVGDYLKAAFTPNGSLPREVFDAWHDTEQQKAAISAQAMFHLRDVKDAVKKIQGTRIPNSAVMAREMQVINDALQGKFQFKQDSPLYQPVKRMRDFIDGLSDELIRSGATDSKLIPHIEAQKGFYLTRSYEAFDNPRWFKKWERTVGPNMANRAKSIVSSWVMDNWIQETKQFAPAQRAFMADKQARFDALSSTAEKLAFVQQQGLPGIFTIDDRDAVTEALRDKAEEWSVAPQGQARIQGEINSLTRRNEDGQLGLFSRGKLGSKNLNILQHRREIPDAVRQMMGEYKGADVNFTKSAAKMAALWQNHQFLTKVRALGLNKFLFEKKQGDHFVELAADGSKTMAPLNGLYTTPEIATAFNQFNVSENLPLWGRLFQLANLYPKLALTVWNPSSIGHNAVSQLSSWILNGHWMTFNPANWRVPIATIAEREGWNGIRGLLGVDQDEARDYLERLTQMGVVEQGAQPGDVAQTLQDTLRRGETLEGLQGITGTFKRGLQYTTKTHEIPNTLTKILQFESERARYSKALPLATPQQLDVMAAKAVRATTPTYSQVPKLIRSTRKFPLVGPFVTFSSEVYRNYINSYRWAYNEFKNPATRGIAISRMVGILIYSSLFAVLAKASASLCNIDSKDDAKFRKFLPDWSKNSQLIWLGNDGKGKLQYIDSSYITHSSLITQPIHALLDGKDPIDAVKQSLLALGKPFIDPQMGTEAILEAYMNARHNSSGGLEAVSNAPEGSAQQFAERAAHAAAPFVPGVVTSAMRIHQAAQGNVTKYGQQRTVADELVRDLGFNVTTLDLRQALKFQAQTYAQNMDQAEARYRMVLTREGNVSATELLQAKSAMEQTRQTEFAKMTDLVVTAKNLGLASRDVDQVLADAQLGKRDIDTLDTGKYEPYSPGKGVLKHAYANAQEQGSGQGVARIAPPVGAVPVGP